MQKIKKMHLLKTKFRRSNRQVRYVPPDAEVMEKLARQVCVTLDGKSGTAYGKPEVVDGLSTFLTVVAQLTAKVLTKGKGDWINGKHLEK